MLAQSVFRSSTIVLLTGLFCAWIACPAIGQPVDEEPAVVTVDPADQPDLTTTASRTPVFRLTRVPNMFGDFFFGGGVFDVSPAPVGQVGFPAIGGGRVKISENNKALPMDRVFFVYNHFQGGILGTDDFPSAPIDRYTIGVEKTFRDGLWSVELRMPFMGSYEYSVSGFNFSEPEAGNLTVTLKRSLYQTCYGAAAVGLGINTPTGGGTTGQIGLNTPDDFTMHNDALYLVPWIGFLSAPNDCLFYQGFLQVDFAATGNRVDINRVNRGRLSQQALLEVDFNVGYWFYRNPCACHLRGLAGILELHYNTPLQDAQILDVSPYITDFMRLGNYYNRMDIWNLTAGLHASLGECTTVRVSGVVPLSEGVSNRVFDSEIRVSINRYF